MRAASSLIAIELDGLDARTVRLPIVRLANRDCLHARSKALEPEWPRSNRPVPIVEAVRNHQQREIAEDMQEVGVSSMKLDGQLLRTRHAHVLDDSERAGPRGLGVGAAMPIDGVGDVLHRQRLAVVEFDAVANLERPCRRARLDLPALQQLRLDAALSVVRDQPVHDLPADVDAEGVHVGRRIQAVGRPRAADAKAQGAARWLAGRNARRWPARARRERRSGSGNRQLQRRPARHGRAKLHRSPLPQINPGDLTRPCAAGAAPRPANRAESPAPTTIAIPYRDDRAG